MPSGNAYNKNNSLEKNKGKAILVIESDDEEYNYRKRYTEEQNDVEMVEEIKNNEGGEKSVIEMEKNEADEDFDESRFWDILENHPEWVDVDLSKIRASVQCPICLGIIKKTRIMNECLHRFCKECIDKSMRLGNKECPACRNHCASRRSLRDDPRFDAIIECLYDDVEKYEKEELALHEEETIRNKQIQESIAKISQKQTEALVSKKGSKQALGKTYNYTTRSGGVRIEKRELENNEDEDSPNEIRESSSVDEIRHETKKRKYTKRKEITQPLPSLGNDLTLNNNRIDNNRIEDTDRMPLLTPDLPTWGTSSARSKSNRTNRATSSAYRSPRKMAKYFNNQKENDLEQVDINCILVSSDEEKVANLEKLSVSCPPCITVEHLKEYVASQMRLLGKDVEILLVKKSRSFDNVGPFLDLSTSVMQTLERQKTLAEVRAESVSNEGHLVLAYRLQKRSWKSRA